MYIFGVYLSVVELLMIFSGFVVLFLLYLAYEINKLKRLEIKLEIIEGKMKEEEKELERDITKLSPRTSKKRTVKKRRR